MNRSHLISVALSALIVTQALPAYAAQGGAAAEVLTNQTVIGMVTAKLNKDLLKTKVSTTRNTFDVTVNGIITLQQNKVPQDVILSMISAAADAKLAQARLGSAEVLENQSVVALVTAKVPRAVVLAKIQNTKANFDTSANGLVNLTQAKVPTDVIKVMVAKGSGN